ncbi:MAG: thioredoxin family protein [Rhodoferax sp.]
MVACLCAQWCGTCNEYAPLFRQLAAEFPHVQFRWVDIEDESELVDPVDIENFPTVLLAMDGKPYFFGTLLPHLETLRRLVTDMLQNRANTTRFPDEVSGLAQRLLGT